MPIAAMFSLLPGYHTQTKFTAKPKKTSTSFYIIHCRAESCRCCVVVVHLFVRKRNIDAAAGYCSFLVKQPLFLPMFMSYVSTVPILIATEEIVGARDTY